MSRHSGPGGGLSQQMHFTNFSSYMQVERFRGHSRLWLHFLIRFPILTLGKQEIGIITAGTRFWAHSENGTGFPGCFCRFGIFSFSLPFQNSSPFCS